MIERACDIVASRQPNTAPGEAFHRLSPRSQLEPGISGDKTPAPERRDDKQKNSAPSEMIPASAACVFALDQGPANGAERCLGEGGVPTPERGGLLGKTGRAREKPRQVQHRRPCVGSNAR